MYEAARLPLLLPADHCMNESANTCTLLAAAAAAAAAVAAAAAARPSVFMHSS